MANVVNDSNFHNTWKWIRFFTQLAALLLFLFIVARIVAVFFE
jgi:hypothetical protein